MVVADADGDLSTQTIPSGGASSINDLSDALVENNPFIGNDPSSTTNSASYNLSLGTGALSNITTEIKILRLELTHLRIIQKVQKT